MNKYIKQLLAVGLVLSALIGVLIYNSLAWGLVFINLWELFIMPAFKAAPELTYAKAVGLVFTISIMGAVRESGEYRLPDGGKLKRDIDYSVVFLRPWIAIGLSSIMHAVLNM